MSRATTSPVRAVTFDFWRTLFFAYSNFDERRNARVRALSRIANVEPERASKAIDHMSREFLRVHVEEKRTLTPADAPPLIAEHLEIQISSDDSAQLIDAFARALLEHPPDPVDGAFDAVRRAADSVPVGIVSDTGIAPGSAIRELLRHHGVGDVFGAASYSDELGVAKPQAAMFHNVAHGLQVETHTLLHIGDLEPTDVVGAHNVGARAALFAGDNDRFWGKTTARYAYKSWADFSGALPSMLKG